MHSGLSLLPKLGGDPMSQLVEEVNSWFTDRSHFPQQLAEIRNEIVVIIIIIIIIIIIYY